MPRGKDRLYDGSKETFKDIIEIKHTTDISFMGFYRGPSICI